MAGGEEYRHANISQSEAAALLEAAGNKEGSFLVRERDDSGWILTLIFRSKVSHHLMRLDEASGFIFVNKKKLGDFSTIEEVVDAMRSKLPGWPVVLTTGIPPPAAAAAPESAGTAADAAPDGGESDGSSVNDTDDEAAEAAVEVQPLVEAHPPDTGYIVIKPDTPDGQAHPSLFPDISKTEADAKLAGRQDGTFLFRPHKKAGDYILSVVFRSKPTHHLVKKEESGAFTINGKSTEGKTDLLQVAKYLESKHPGWPLELTEGIQAPQAAQAPAAADTSQADEAAAAAAKAEAEAAKAAAAAEAEKKEAAAKEEAKRRALVEKKSEEEAAADKAKAAAATMVQAMNKSKDLAKTAAWKWGSKKGGDASYPYLHKAIEKTEADDLLAGKPDGTFLFRPHNKEGDYILSVVFRSKPTHHLVGRKVPGDSESELLVNKKPSGSSCLKEVEHFLAIKSATWPVPLINGIKVELPAEPEPAPEPAPAPTPEPAAAAPVQEEQDGVGSSTDEEVEVEVEEAAAPAVPGIGLCDELWYHGFISREQCEGLLQGKDDMTFLVRLRKEDEPNAFILSVVFRGKPTHHLLARTDSAAEFHLNKKPTGCNTLREVRERYRTKQPSWPVPLTTEVHRPVAKPAVKKVKKVKKAQAKPAPAPAPAPAAATPTPTTTTTTTTSAVPAPEPVPSPAKPAESLRPEPVLAPEGAAPSAAVVAKGRGADTKRSDRELRGLRGLLMPLLDEDRADLLRRARSIVLRWDAEDQLDALAAVSESSDDDESESENGSDAEQDGPGLLQLTVEEEEDLPASALTHPHMTNTAAEEVLMEPPLAEGKYFLRPRHEQATAGGQFILNMVFHGKPTHHLLEQQGGGTSFVVNKSTQLPNCTTLDQVLTVLRSAQPFWPVPLQGGIPNPEAEEQIRKERAARRAGRATERRHRQAERAARRQQRLDEQQGKARDAKVAQALRRLNGERPGLPPNPHLAEQQMLAATFDRLCGDLSLLEKRLPKAIKADERSRKQREEDKARAEELFKPVKFRRSSVAANPTKASPPKHRPSKPAAAPAPARPAPQPEPAKPEPSIAEEEVEEGGPDPAGVQAPASKLPPGADSAAFGMTKRLAAEALAKAKASGGGGDTDTKPATGRAPKRAMSTKLSSKLSQFTEAQQAASATTKASRPEDLAGVFEERARAQQQQLKEDDSQRRAEQMRRIAALQQG